MEISFEGPLMDFLVKLVNPADPNPSRTPGPSLGRPTLVAHGPRVRDREKGATPLLIGS